MESTFVKLRQELNDLGYIETLKPDCVPLVDRLFSDLKTTTQNLQKYMKISQQAIEEQDSLRLGAEPYKCDNAKLIRECNELHLAFIQFKEQHEKVQKDLKVKIVSLENQLQNCESEKQNLKKRIKDLDSGQPDKKAGVKAKGPIPRTVDKGKTFRLDSAMGVCRRKDSSSFK
ncbi:hypothetical protein NQ318_005580 [Aromia moschata]|uniref:Uncharacterized protein n=1 Tax=Aromia moschata TaxID=1265417 RepID=A0AAV8XIE2_9CUCU|nr:hypothetical protein NQ318_005580 [Aromia moschata]